MNIEGKQSRCGALSLMCAGALAFGLVACGKDEPPQAVQPAVVQPAPPPEAKAGEIRTETPEPTSMPRSDPNGELASKVKTALHTTPGLEALAVDIVAAEGAVTLFGTADSRDSVAKAGKVASSVPGVKSVQNKIVVVRGS